MSPEQSDPGSSPHALEKIDELEVIAYRSLSPYLSIPFVATRKLSRIGQFTTGRSRNESLQDPSPAAGQLPLTKTVPGTLRYQANPPEREVPTRNSQSRQLKSRQDTRIRPWLVAFAAKWRR
jgi:hypothetical protein